MDEFTREPDPDFARLPDDYGEDDSEGVVVYTYEGPSRPASPDTVKRLMLLTKYTEALARVKNKSGVVGARRDETDEVDAMRLELVRLGFIDVDGEYLAGDAEKNGPKFEKAF